jgi:hypothetical protein
MVGQVVMSWLVKWRTNGRVMVNQWSGDGRVMVNQWSGDGRAMVV